MCSGLNTLVMLHYLSGRFTLHNGVVLCRFDSLTDEVIMKYCCFISQVLTWLVFL